MSSDTPTTVLSRLLAEAHLPPAALRLAYSAHPELHEVLASNAHLPNDVFESLCSSKMGAKRALALAESCWNSEQIDMLLTTGETRSKPLSTLISRWHLSTAQYEKIAARKILPAVRDDMLYNDRVPAHVRAMLSAQTADNASRWLLENPSTDDSTTLALLAGETLRGEVFKPQELLEILQSRPGVVTALLSDANLEAHAAETLAVLAALTDDQVALHRLFDICCQRGVFASYMVALPILARPEIDPEFRAQIWDAIAGSDAADMVLKELPLPVSSPILGVDADGHAHQEAVNLLLAGFSSIWWLVPVIARLAEQPMATEQRRRMLFKLDSVNWLSHWKPAIIAHVGAAIVADADTAAWAALLETTENHLRNHNKRPQQAPLTKAKRVWSIRGWHVAVGPPTDAQLREATAGLARYSTSHLSDRWMSLYDYALVLWSRIGEDETAWMAVLATVDTYPGTVAEFADDIAGLIGK